MRKFKQMVIKTINRDLLDIYKHLNPTTADFSFVIHLCESLSTQKKNKFSENLAKKLQKQHDNREYLNLLILCDFLSATKPELLPQFPSKIQSILNQRKKVKCVSKEQKLELAQSSYLKFYLDYLKQKVWGCHVGEDLSLNNLRQGLIYSQSSLSALKILLRHDFIAEFVLTNSQFKNQIKISLENILRRSSQDLNFLIKFVQKWTQIIIKGEAQSITMNDVYQQLIYINKNISKLQYLNKKINGNIKFAKYEFNKKLNTQIQKSMIPRQSERKSFYSQKRLKTQGDHGHDNQQRMQEQITESQIYMKFKL